jgi:hypothetical protein
MPRRRKGGKPPLSAPEVLAWADAFRRSRGRWPDRFSGSAAGTLHETWMAVDTALFYGHRRLPAGGSLPQLLAKYRGHRHRNYLPRLTVGRILAWADAHKRRTGSRGPSPGCGSAGRGRAAHSKAAPS